MAFDRARYIRKMTSLVGSIILLGIVFYFFKHDMVVWLCNEESNNASCFLAYESFQEKGQKRDAQHFLNKSCGLDYPVACERIAIDHWEQKEDDKAFKMIRKACKLDRKTSCEFEAKWLNSLKNN
jgi:hypothetical protein